MIELFAAGTPNGIKIAIALEWLELDYKLTPIALRGDTPRPDAFKAASPLGKIPAIHDRETGIMLSESGAILIYLAEKTRSSLLPTEPVARATTLQWHFIAAATIGPALSQAHHYLHFQKGKAPYAEERAGGEAKRYYTVLDQRLAQARYLAGDEISIADITMWPFLARSDWQGIDLNDYPSVARWHRELATVPAFIAGQEKFQG